MKFIDWALNELEDEAKYKRMFEEAHELLLQYEKMPKKDVIEAIYNKLELARAEYGEPDPNHEYDFDKELGMEIIDLVFGWPLVKRYLDNRVENMAR